MLNRRLIVVIISLGAAAACTSSGPPAYMPIRPQPGVPFQRPAGISECYDVRFSNWPAQSVQYVQGTPYQSGRTVSFVLSDQTAPEGCTTNCNLLLLRQQGDSLVRAGAWWAFNTGRFTLLLGLENGGTLSVSNNHAQLTALSIGLINDGAPAVTTRPGRCPRDTKPPGQAATALSPLALRTPGLDTSSAFRESYLRWTGRFEPFTVIGNIHYVGSAGLSAFLITTPRGHILLDGGMAENAPQVLANIRAELLDPREVRYLINSHAHFDHSGALAALQAATGAEVVASEGDRPWLEKGHVPYGPSAEFDTEPVRVSRVIRDGESIELGGTRLTAMITPGHTPGCTSWRMTTRDASGAEQRVFFHCSASIGGQTVAPESYPGMVADYRRSFDRVAAVQADVFLANHAEVFGLAEKRERQRAGDANAFVDPAALGAYNTRMREAFERELARQASSLPPARP